MIAMTATGAKFMGFFGFQDMLNEPVTQVQVLLIAKLVHWIWTLQPGL